MQSWIFTSRSSVLLKCCLMFFFFFGNHDTFFRILWWIEIHKNSIHWIQIFCDIINVFTFLLLINLICPCWIKVEFFNIWTEVYAINIQVKKVKNVTIWHAFEQRLFQVLHSLSHMRSTVGQDWFSLRRSSKFVFHSTLLILIFSKIKHGIFFPSWNLCINYRANYLLCLG